MKLLGLRLSARDFDRQVAEIQIRAAILNGLTALGIGAASDLGENHDLEGLRDQALDYAANRELTRVPSGNLASFPIPDTCLRWHYLSRFLFYILKSNGCVKYNKKFDI